MKAVHRFIRRHLSPADLLAEMIFGLVMALGVTGAVRIGTTDLDNRELLISVGGCNLAWGIVDGVVLVLMRMFERGRLARRGPQPRRDRKVDQRREPEHGDEPGVTLADEALGRKAPVGHHHASLGFLLALWVRPIG